MAYFGPTASHTSGWRIQKGFLLWEYLSKGLNRNTAAGLAYLWDRHLIEPKEMVVRMLMVRDFSRHLVLYRDHTFKREEISHSEFIVMLDHYHGLSFMLPDIARSLCAIVTGKYKYRQQYSFTNIYFEVPLHDIKPRS